jgi:hypothetical protein
VHDDRRAQLLGVFGALVHFFGRRRGNVQVVTLTLAGFRLGLVNRLHAEIETVIPAHERLRIDVFVVLGEVEPAAQALVNRAPVVLRRQAELGLDGAAQQRAAVLVQAVALDLDAVRWPVTGLDVGQREAHVFETQAAYRLEAEHVADQRGEHVDHRTFFEQVDRIGNERVETAVIAGYVLYRIGAPLVMIPRQPRRRLPRAARRAAA